MRPDLEAHAAHSRRIERLNGNGLGIEQKAFNTLGLKASLNNFGFMDSGKMGNRYPGIGHGVRLPQVCKAIKAP